ncbi:MAG: hypothetical protein IPN03_10210 [Holophagales bacterium]|nr:hypothetical protein [Holophagales bacterium]
MLLALAALLAPRAEASRTSVWEQNPPAAFSVARTEAASALASIAPAAVADVEAEEPRRFDLGDVILVERELGHEERLDLGPLTLVDLNLLRGPLSSYPETRVRGFELLPPFRIGASPSLSLWPRRACGFPCLGLVSDGPEDPWGLRTFFTADVGPGDVLPTLNMETGNTAVDAVLGVGNNLFNLAAKFVNAGMNFGKGAAVVQDKLDEKVAEKGIACRGCTSFGIDMAGALSGTREAQAAYEVLGAYGRALSGRFAPAPAVGAGEAGAAVEKSSSPSQLKAGRSWEEAELASLGKTKNTEVWRPTPEDIDSAAFKTVVGPAKYTPKGLPVGTSVDVAEAGGSIEIKGGTKVLESSYQLRLQTYHALKTETPLTIRTARPVNPTFADWLSRWGVNVENPSVVKPATGGAP